MEHPTKDTHVVHTSSLTQSHLTSSGLGAYKAAVTFSPAHSIFDHLFGFSP